MLPSDEQLGWIADLRAADARFERDALPADEPSVAAPMGPVRFAWGIGRRIRNRLPRLASATFKIGRLLKRRVKRLTHRVRSGRLPVTIRVGDCAAAVIDLSAAHLTELIAQSTNDLIIFVRNGSAVTAANLAAFAREMAAAPDAQLWFSDSLSLQGFRIYRPAPSHLLTEQADWFGAIIGVDANIARAVASSPASDGTSFVQQLALEVAEAETRHLDLVSGTAAFCQSLSSYPAPARTPRAHPLVSIIIPTRGTCGDVIGSERVFVTEAVRSIISRTTYANYEIVVVADDPTPQAVIDELERIAGPRLRIVRWSAPFNFSEKMNLGASVSQGELLLMLNDDVEVASASWLDEMVALLERDEFVAAGALLFFEDLTLQHAGHLYRGGAGHVGFGKTLTPSDPNTSFHFDREVSGATGACLLVPKQEFAAVGGFSTQFPGNYNDVDLCLKLRANGGRIVCSGGARLYHFESKSRDATVRPEDLERIHARWSAELATDRFWPSPH